MIFKQLFYYLGARESLREWRIQTRSDHRLAEIQAIFEYNNTDRSLNGDLKVSLLSPANLEKIIPRESIKGYFDMICRDGTTTVDIGEYLDLNKKNIFGGGDYAVNNERMTFVNVDLDRSVIDLGNFLS